MRPRTSERGFALAVSIFALVIIAALITGVFFAARQEMKIGEHSMSAQQAFSAADAGVNNHDVNGLRREIRIRRTDGQRAIEQIERGDVVGDVHDRRIRIDFQNDALQRADQMVVGAVVRRQRDDRVGQEVLSSK